MSVETETPALSDDAAAQLRDALAAIEDASFDVLMSKPRRTTAFMVHIDRDGQPRPVRIRYRAIAPKELDALIEAHPPSTKEERKGAQWNKDSFPPALVSAVSLSPKMSVEQAKELLENPNWSTGESQALFSNAWAVCNAGLDVPFSNGD